MWIVFSVEREKLFSKSIERFLLLFHVIKYNKSTIAFWFVLTQPKLVSKRIILDIVNNKKEAYIVTEKLHRDYKFIINLLNKQDVDTIDNYINNNTDMKYNNSKVRTIYKFSIDSCRKIDSKLRAYIRLKNLEICF